MHIAEFSVKNPVMVNLIMVAILVIGIILGTRTPLELFPTIQIEMVMVTTVFPGASAEDVEQLVSIPIEDKLQTLKGVKVIRSVSSEGLSQVFAELEAGEDVKKAAQDARSEIAKLRAELPEDAEDPVVQEVEAEVPLINVAIAGDVERSVLRMYALRLRDELQQIPGVGRIITTGMGDPVFWVDVDPIRLRQFDLRLEEIVRAIQLRNLDLPGGSVEQGAMEYLVRTRGRIRTVRDLLDIPIRRDPEGHHVFLKDIARVRLGEEESTTLARLNGMPAITFWVSKRKGADAVQTVERIRARVRDFQRRVPEGIHLYVSNDTSYWVRHRFRTMVKNGLIGLVIVLILLSLFLDYRAAAMAALGIPVSFLGAVILMRMTGMTLNVLTMFGMILVLGIIVDDAIIVVENAQRYIQQGMSPVAAAVRGTREVTIPVIATILTNIASFLPLMMATGLIGKFLSIIPQVAIYTFLVSLTEALLILPSHCADFLRPMRPNHVPRRFRWFIVLRNHYLRGLIFVMRHRYMTVVAFLFVLVLTMGVLFRMPFVLFYERDIALFAIRIENPTDADMRSTESVVRKAERIIQSTIPAHVLKNINVLIGIDTSRRQEPEFGDHLATILVEYVEFEQRKENGLVLQNQVRRRMARELVGPARVEFVRQGGPPRGKPVDVRIQGRDFTTLKTIAERVESFLADIPGVYAITDDLSWGKPEIVVQVDEQRAAIFGLTTTQIARIIRAAGDGLTVARTRIGKEEAKINVRYATPPGDIHTLLATVQIPAPTGGWVPLGDVVRLVERPSMLRIHRYDMERAVRVMAEVNQNVITAHEVNARLDAFLRRMIRNYPGYSYAFGGEEEELRESIRSIFEAAAIAVLLVYVILASLLRSYTQPFIIMSVLPFAVIGVAIGILIRGEPFSMPALIGTVALLGIVVNDSLVMMDFINQRRKWLHRVTAVFYSAKHRFRPIILTTITTFGGLASLMTKTRGEEAFLAPMAIALGFGLLFATLLTLFLIPSLYLILDDMHNVLRRVGRMVRRRPEAVPEEKPAVIVTSVRE